MNKIASPQELQRELHRVLAYLQEQHPSREKIVYELQKLADSVEAKPRIAGLKGDPSMTEGKELANLLKEEWTGVSYKDSTDEGRTHVPSLGVILWHTSGNDPAVIVRLPATSFKTDPPTAAKVIKTISKLLGGV